MPNPTPGESGFPRVADPLTEFIAIHRRALPPERRGAKRFNAGEHAWLASHGAERACAELLQARGIAVDPTLFSSIRRRDGRESLPYGELVALSGDFYPSPEALFEETPSPVPWLWEANDLSDLRRIFDEELRWIEARQRGLGRATYPDENIRLAWNAKAYVELALRNTDHFGWHNLCVYVRHHTEALRLAAAARGLENETFRRALYVNAFADHFLTDGFAAGHVRVPRAEIIAWAKARGLSEKIAGALSKLLHDQDGHVSTQSLHGAGDEDRRASDDGLWVQDSTGTSWRTRCDGQLFLATNAAGSPPVERAVAAVAASVGDLLLAWKRRELPTGTYAATTMVPFPHPDGPTLAHKFPADMPAAELERLWQSVTWYMKIPYLSGLEQGHIRDLLVALPQLMADFRANVAAEADRHPDLVARMAPAYVAAFRAIDLHEVAARPVPTSRGGFESLRGYTLGRAVGMGSSMGSATRGLGHPPADHPPAADGSAGADAAGTAPTTGSAKFMAVRSGPDAAPVRRQLVGDLPPQVQMGTAVSLLVSLEAAPAPGAMASEPFSAQVGTVIDVVVKATEGLSLVGPRDGTLRVDEADSGPLQFKLMADRVGRGKVCVYAFCQGRSLACLHLATEIGEAAVTVREGNGGAVADVTVVRLEPPDLSMYIFEDGNRLTFKLQSADRQLNMLEFGPTTLTSSPREHFRTFFRDIENLSLDTVDKRMVARRRLEAKGANLFNTVFPEDLRALLWELRDRVSTLQISSDEPWIPWEVCRLQGKSGGRVVEGPFFAEAFAVTRWFCGVAVAPRLGLRNLALVVPGDSELQQAADEKGYVLSLAGPQRKITEVPATYLDVTRAMASGSYDAWHFVGHARADDGTDADQSAIELSRRELLTPEDVSGESENVLLPRPFVFLNACQSARGGLSLTGVGGWAQRFLQAGPSKLAASAFIGSYWSVFDEAALAFAKVLYAELLGGCPMGEAAKRARLHIRAQNDPTWLAYTIYADPYATAT